MKPVLCFFVFVLCSFFSISQSFIDVADEQSIIHKYENGLYGGGVSFCDFNQDGWDDLSFPDANGNFKFYINNEGSFEEIWLHDFPGSTKSFIWVDYDNDGDLDLSYTEEQGIFRLYENTGELTFSELDLNLEANTSTDNFGISWSDYNSDGFLDFYVCRYINANAGEEVTNLLIKNNGDGTFTDVTEEAGVGDGFQQSFMGTWADFDNDGDSDLHVSNDRTIYPNSLYRNDGDGTFTDISSSSNVDIEIFAMTSTVADYDNDEDMDIYCTNGFAGNHLLKNEGNNLFTDLFPLAGCEAYTFTWGANWIDFENDGWKDLFVCAGNPFDSDNRWFHNAQNGTFETFTNMATSQEDDSHGVAKGDFNNDGKYDLAILNEDAFNSRLLQNNYLTTNKYVKVNLEGTHSNTDAIGSKITYYVNGNPHVVFMTCGSDFCSQDSQHKILGIGNNGEIDSLKINWHRGLEEWHFNLQAAETYSFIEGETISILLSQEGTLEICQGESFQLEALYDYESIIWTNESDNEIIEISEPGTYSAQVTLPGGYVFPTSVLEVIVNELPSNIDVNIQDALCANDSTGTVEIVYDFDLENALVQNEFYDELPEGQYSIGISNSDGCQTVVTFQIDAPSPVINTIQTTDVSCFGEEDGTVDVDIFGGTQPFELQFEPEVDPESLSAGEYEYTITDFNNCISNGSFSINEPTEPTIDIFTTNAIGTELGEIIIDIQNLEGIIEVFLNGELADINNTGLSVGDYDILISNDSGCNYEFSTTIESVEGISESLGLVVINYFPNPVKNNLSITNFSSNGVYDIWNSSGQKVISSGSFSNSSIGVSDLKPGIYFCLAISENKCCMLKFIKE